MKELAGSILAVGLINPIMVDQAHTLIAGLYRLEAMKLLGRTEIECTVSDLDGLQVALAEISSLRIHGMGYTGIARLLNKRGVPAPGAYLYQRGLSDRENYRDAL